jgi:hypothetical protein
MTQEALKQKLIAAQINPLYLPSSYHKVEVLPMLGVSGMELYHAESSGISKAILKSYSKTSNQNVNNQLFYDREACFPTSIKMITTMLEVARIFYKCLQEHFFKV